MFAFIVSILALACEVLPIKRKRKGTIQDSVQHEIESDNIKMPDVIKDDRFCPDFELTHFAVRISQSYTNMSQGEHVSYNENYRLLYNDFQDNTPARIADKSYRIELNPFILIRDGSQNYVYFLVLWCFCYAQLLKKGTNDLATADRLTLEYYLRTGRSTADVINGFCRMTRTHLNLNRIAQLRRIIERTSFP